MPSCRESDCSALAASVPLEAACVLGRFRSHPGTPPLDLGQILPQEEAFPGEGANEVDLPSRRSPPAPGMPGPPSTDLAALRLPSKPVSQLSPGVKTVLA